MKRSIVRLATVGSTQKAAESLPIGSVVIADQQTEGRGRHGHGWESPPGEGLYLSIVLPPHPVLTLALGLAARAALMRITTLECDIRWPNDLLLHERKLGGILVEMHDGRAVAGIGINIGQRLFPPDLASESTSLYIETGLEFRRDDLADALLIEIDKITPLSVPEVIAAFESASSYAQSKAVRVAFGEQRLEGITCGLTPQGFLQVRQADGSVEVVIAGGVRPSGPHTMP